MKKLLCILMLLLLLSGCAETPAATTDTTVQPTVTEPEPTGLYDPDSLLEQQTGGAVRVYPLGGNNYTGVTLMGSRLLLCKAPNTLQVLRGEQGELVAEEIVGEDGYALYPAMDLDAQGMAYFSKEDNAVIFLNPQLQENVRFPMPEQLQGNPLISMEKQETYYCVPGEIRALNTETGISRLIKTHTYAQQTLEGCYFDGNVILCLLTDEAGNTDRLYLDTQTGMTLASNDSLYTLHTYGDRFLGCRLESGRNQIIFGTREDQKELQFLAEYPGVVSEALAKNGAVTYERTEGGIVVYFHDLRSGKTTGKVALEAVADPVMITADESFVWILAQVGDTQALLRWDPAMTPAEENRIETQPLYTLANPDESGLAQCQETANAMNKAYAPRIHIWQDAVKVTGGYSAVAEYNGKTTARMLAQLEEVLKRFPDGFLAQTVDSGNIRIGLVHSLQDDKPFVQFWENGNCYILISAEADLEEAVLRGIGFAIDAHVMGHSRDYDFWENRSPEGFAYTLTEDISAIPEEYLQYLEGESRAFMEPAAMGFAHVDRAYIWAEAMKADNSELFSAPFLQQKILRICEGIREAYNVEKVKDPYPWEQYLTEEMNFSNYNRD